MAKEWILNSVMNRFQLNFKRNVGATSASIRGCAPKSMEEWRKFYFSEVRSEEAIKDLGRRLYTKITEVIPAEIESITEEDCINYMVQLVIDRTYNGYRNEIKTIYGQVEESLGCSIQPASDDWDRRYNVDFYISIKDCYIGLQIKPVPTGFQLSQIHKERNIQHQTHKEFTKKYGGKVFYIYSQSDSSKAKTIINPEILEEIKNEISRLQNLANP